MKSVVARSSVFVLGLLIFLGVCEMGFRLLTFDFTDNQYQALAHKSGFDTIIIGPSSSLHGIDPDLLTGRKAYNFSIEGSTFAYWQEWFGIFFPTGDISPDTVIISIDTFNLYQETGRNIYQDASRWTLGQTWNYFLDAPDHKKDALGFLLRLRQGWKLLTRTNNYRFARSENGYIGLQSQMSETESQEVASSQSIVAREENLAQLQGLIQMIQETGAEVILVQLPYYRPFQDNDPAHTPASQIIQTVADEMGVGFIDFNTDAFMHITQNPSYFESRLHLNADGAHVTTKMLDTLLLKN